MARHRCTNLHPVDLYIGQRIKEGRKARNCPLAALARATGVSVQQLHKYESGRNRVSASKLHDIARFLDLPLLRFYPEQEVNAMHREAISSEVRNLIQRFEAISDKVTRQKISRLIKAISDAPLDDGVDEER